MLPPLFSGRALTPVLDSHDFDQWRPVIEDTLQLLHLQGWSQERINGQWETAEPGEALLMQPGDRLEGITGCGAGQPVSGHPPA